MSARTPSFEVVFDRCLDDLAAGRATLEQCLAAWPQYAERLRPLLETATVVRALPQPAVGSPDPMRRAALFAQLRTTPQQRARRRWINPLGALRLPALRLATIAAPAAAIAAVAVLALFALGRNTAYASTLTIFTGDVERQVGTEWRPIADGAHVREGERLRAADGAHALLTFRDGSTVGMDANADVRLTQARFDGARAIALTQYAGRLWNQVATDDRAGARYSVATANTVVTAHGTVFATSVDGDTINVDTAEGIVDVQSGESHATVRAGERVAASQRRIEATAHDAAPRAEMRVAAPFAASLVAPDGAAAGARPDGLTFNQIAGVVTSNPARGPQTIDVRAPRPGDYTLRLRRVADGDGEVVLATANGDAHRIAIPADEDTIELRVRVDASGAISVLDRSTPLARPASTTPMRTASPAERPAGTASPPATRSAERSSASDGTAPGERLVITEADRQRAQEMREQLKQQLERQQREREQQRQRQQQQEQRQREEQQRRDTRPTSTPGLQPTSTARSGD